MKENPRTVTVFDFNTAKFKKEIVEEFERVVTKLSKRLNPIPPETYLTRIEAAKFLGVSLMTIHNWSKLGIIHPMKIGTRIRFKKSELVAVLENSKK